MMITPSDPVSSHRSRPARERLTATLSGELASRWSRLLIAAASARGKHHRVNEDSHSPLDGIAPVFVVADGVGGGSFASWASRELVSRVHKRLEHAPIDAGAVADALLAADREIAKGIAHRSATSGAATVAMCAATGVLRRKWLVAWVGDCRAYRLPAENGAPAQLLTRDDTYRNLGEDPPPGGSQNDPARMIGNGAVSAPNVAHVELARDEMLVLMSDGVHRHVDVSDIGRILHAETPLARRCLRLVEAARSNGSVDDATVLVVQRARAARIRLFRYVAAAIIGAMLLAALVAWWPRASAPPAANTTLESSP